MDVVSFQGSVSFYLFLTVGYVSDRSCYSNNFFSTVEALVKGSIVIDI